MLPHAVVSLGKPSSDQIPYQGKEMPGEYVEQALVTLAEGIAPVASNGK